MKLNLDKWIPILLAAYFIVVTFIIWPFGNFPLNDDWVHTLTIYTWLSEGRFWYPAWLAPTTHIPIIYGMALGKLFGFSFVLLRMTTLVCAWGSCVILYHLLREYNISRQLSAAGVFVLATNPLFLHLSFTFMSDIPALFFLLCAAFFYTRGFHESLNSKTTYLCIGSMFAVLGFYTRQFVILIALAAGIIFFLHIMREKKSFKNFISFCIAFVVPALLCGGIYIFLSKFHALPGELHARLIPEQWSVVEMTLFQGWYILLYCAFFLSPLIVAILVKNISFFKDRIYTLLFGITVMGILYATSQKLFFPKFSNIFSWFGIGPSVDQVLQGVLPVWGNNIMYIAANSIAYVSLLMGSMLAGFYVISKVRKKNIIHVFIVFCVLYFLLISSLRSFDRYILFLLPFGIFFTVCVIKQFSWSKITYGILLICIGIYGVLGTHHYFRWNEARWSLAQDLRVQGIPAREIDAGYEWVGWHLYGKEIITQAKDFSQPWYIRELYPSHPRTYVLSFSPLKGYTVVTQHGLIFLLKKNP